jgi:hypothetical protein
MSSRGGALKLASASAREQNQRDQGEAEAASKTGEQVH